MCTNNNLFVKSCDNIGLYCDKKGSDGGSVKERVREGG